MRRFCVIGQTASAGPDFSLDDLPATSGRLDVLLRCVRAALLVSHGVRKDAVVYLVLLGGPLAPRALRVEGAIATYLRPDERSFAGMARKVLATVVAEPGQGFVGAPHGMALAAGGLDAVLADLAGQPFTPYLLDEAGADVRGAALDLTSPLFVLGDHVGLDEAARASLARQGAAALSLGPLSVHADDAIAIISNELDRRTSPRA